jgi:hypothetical protein
MATNNGKEKTSRDPIFDVKALVTALDVAHQAYTAALEKSEEGGQQPDARWYKNILWAEWGLNKPGANSTQRVPIMCRLGSVEGRLVVKAFGEKHTGRIDPLLDEDVAKINTELKGRSFSVKKRTREPAIQVQKYTVPVPTEADGVTVAKDEGGKPKYPSDDKISTYYRFAEHLETFLITEYDIHTAPEFKGPGRLVASSNIPLRKKGEKGATAAIIPTAGVITVPSLKLAVPTQRVISNDSIKNAGKDLPNPMTRITMKFNKDTLKPTGFAIHNMDKKFYNPEKKRYDFELATVEIEGKQAPVDAANIHAFLLSGSKVDLIVNADSICSSNLGISIPIQAKLVVASAANRQSIGTSDLYGDEEEEEEEEDDGQPKGEDRGEGPAEIEKPQAPVPAKPTTPAVPTKVVLPAAPPKLAAPKQATSPEMTKPASPKPAPSEENLSDLISDLGAL